MATMAVITPSYGPDLHLCRELHLSLTRFAAAGTAHHVIVPARDRDRFAGIGDVRPVDEFLPTGFYGLPANLWVNVRRPVPLIRGWIAQQLTKLAAAAAEHSDVALLVDSDMVFVRPFSVATFHRDGAARFYRSPNAIDERLPDHVRWHRVARRLLGLPPPASLPLPDYVGWPMCWDPNIVRAMLAHVERIARCPWATAIGSELHFSEGILYGVYVDEVLGGSPFTESTMLSIAYSNEVPLDREGTKTFLASLAPADIAVMISAKSRTDFTLRTEAFAALTKGAAEQTAA